MSFNYAAGQEVWNRYLYWHLKLETVSHNSSILEWPHSKVNCKIQLLIYLCADASNYYHGQADIPLPVQHEETCPKKRLCEGDANLTMPSYCPQDDTFLSFVQVSLKLWGDLLHQGQVFAFEEYATKCLPDSVYKFCNCFLVRKKYFSVWAST